MTIAELYTQLPLPALLQTHMIRVAKTGLWLVQHWQGPDFDQQLLIRALLVHDLGNLVKFDLSPTAKIKLLNSVEINHWRRIQSELITTYGRDVDQVTASLILAANLEQGNEIATIVSKHTGEGLAATVKEDDWIQKLFDYADFRVGPFGILSLHERFSDLQERYQNRDALWADSDWVNSRLQLFLELEQQIAAHLSTSLTTLTNDALSQWSDQEIFNRNW